MPEFHGPCVSMKDYDELLAERNRAKKALTTICQLCDEATTTVEVDGKTWPCNGTNLGRIRNVAEYGLGSTELESEPSGDEREWTIKFLEDREAIVEGYRCHRGGLVLEEITVVPKSRLIAAEAERDTFKLSFKDERIQHGQTLTSRTHYIAQLAQAEARIAKLTELREAGNRRCERLEARIRELESEPSETEQERDHAILQMGTLRLDTEGNRDRALRAEKVIRGLVDAYDSLIAFPPLPLQQENWQKALRAARTLLS